MVIEKPKKTEQRKYPTWRDDPVIKMNERIAEERRLIKEKDLQLGQKVLVTTIKMKGVIESISTGPTEIPVYVRRSDGEIFPYSASEIKVLKN